MLFQFRSKSYLDEGYRGINSSVYGSVEVGKTEQLLLIFAEHFIPTDYVDIEKLIIGLFIKIKSFNKSSKSKLH